jgi:site-specific DNA-methyltransferase (adenine-specific)
VVIPFEPLWEQYKRIIKDNGAIILFAQGMFTAKLMLSNEKMWRYNLIWKKGDRTSGFLNAKRMPLRNHEDICVFYKKLPTYNPQFTQGQPLHSIGPGVHKITNNNYGNFNEDNSSAGSTEKYPKSVLNFDRPHPPIHPTQKPVELVKWLIKTYTNEGELVLDNCIGSGTTAVAALETNRNFIGFETQQEFVDIANNRLNKYNG